MSGSPPSSGAELSGAELSGAELSGAGATVTGPSREPARSDAVRSGVGPLDAWAGVVSAAVDPALVLDRGGLVVSASPAFAELLDKPITEMTGRHLVDEVLELLDFGVEAGPADSYSTRIPPVLSLSANVLTRGLLRARRGDGGRVTLDAVASPLHDGSGHVVGSLTFFARV